MFQQARNLENDPQAAVWCNTTNEVVIMAALHAILTTLTAQYKGTAMMSELERRMSPWPRLP